MSENIYKKARLRAAKTHSYLSTAEGAATHLCIRRQKYLEIEQEDASKNQRAPEPDEVVMMAETYRAPELCDYYCTHQCPIGKGKKPLIYDDLGKISSSLMAALHFLENANDDIHLVLADSRVDEMEQRKFQKIIQTLEDISHSADSLILWAKTQGMIE